jgi:hypothetical protein
MNKIIASVFLALLLGACASSPRKVSLEPSNEYPPPGTVIEKVFDLGHGFQNVHLGESIPGKYKIVDHYSYLYYGKQRLSRIQRCSVSPSGKHAIYQEAQSGCLFLFTPATNNLIQLTQRYIGYADSFRWREEANRVHVFLYKSWRPKRTFKIE